MGKSVYLSNTLLLSFLSLLNIHCGAPEGSGAVQPLQNLPPTGTQTTAASPNLKESGCAQFLKSSQQDYDGDGILDYDELFGQGSMVNGNSVRLYSNPLNKNTFQDDLTDKEVGEAFESVSTPVLGLKDFSLPVSPKELGIEFGHRAFLIRVYAQGGAESSPFLNPATAASGWNSYSKIKLRFNDRLEFSDLSAGLGDPKRIPSLGNLVLPNWQGGQGNVTAIGSDGLKGVRDFASDKTKYKEDSSSFMSCLKASDCQRITGTNGELVGRLVSSAAMDLGTLPFHIGKLMSDLVNATLPKSVPQARDGSYLQLKFNDCDSYSTCRSSNSGFLTVLVKISNPDDYPQIDPTSAGQEARLALMYQQLCGSDH